jgi:hypothetical protein
VGDGYGEPPRLAAFFEAIIGSLAEDGEEGVFRRRRNKNNSIPKSANPTIPPTTPPAIAPAFFVLVAEGGSVGTGVELRVVRPVGVVGNVVVVPVAESVVLGGEVDSGPPEHYFRGLDQRGYKMRLTGRLGGCYTEVVRRLQR